MRQQWVGRRKEAAIGGRSERPWPAAERQRIGKGIPGGWAPWAALGCSCAGHLHVNFTGGAVLDGVARFRAKGKRIRVAGGAQR